MHSNERLLVL